MKLVMMKTLTRIRLINWHYFVNETININGSLLVSGENTAGKSTILDAVQFVLTTNQRRFNTAANEKSRRDLKGYVRCKTGDEGSTYARKGSVVTYVAIEFYEEKREQYFTLGVKIDSPDEESRLSVKWFLEECKLDDLSFTTDNRPSLTEEFFRETTKVNFIPRSEEARSKFGRRLGNLESRFFEMVPKALAFKPMDNVKEFINRFILAEKSVEVENLRRNIGLLKELEDLMGITKIKIYDLENILSKADDIFAKGREILINEVLIEKAEIESKKNEIDNISKSIEAGKQQLGQEQNNLEQMEAALDRERGRYTGLQVSLEKNETASLIKDTEYRIRELKREQESIESSLRKLEDMLKHLSSILAILQKQEHSIISKEDFLMLGSAASEDDSNIKADALFQLKSELPKILNSYQTDNVRLSDSESNLRNKKINVEQEIVGLKNKKITFPENTRRLIQEIEKEFVNRGITSKARVLSDMIEITNPKWQNAVEGYLNHNRLYVIVESQHYDVAFEVYNRLKNEIQTAGLVNTKKTDFDIDVDQSSLAYVIKSDSRVARRYAEYLLNPVVCCDNVKDLLNHECSITQDCIVYENLALRRIDEAVYQLPYIGDHAIEVQLERKLFELQEINEEIEKTQIKLQKVQEILAAFLSFRMEVIEENLDAPHKSKWVAEERRKEELELKKAQQDPSYIQLNIQLEECSRLISAKQHSKDTMNEKIGRQKEQLDNSYREISEKQKQIIGMEAAHKIRCNENEEIASLGRQKYDEQIKIKTPAIIVYNFSPMKAGLENKKNDLIGELIKMQLSYCSKNDCDLGSGYEMIGDYREEHQKLIGPELIKYEGDLEKAKENCYLEFKESFIARLRENIENARMEFRSLNSALKDIYYGEDRYSFELTPNKEKSNLYRMITSERNEEGFNLWTESFQTDYKNEMNDLFSKLTAYDDKGEEVLKEYTDYRNYLDYDILVDSKTGSRQRFSKIYGEKSGGETQTPFYVAIAASFVQLYRAGDTIRIVMFDEAFDKMDDNRISSMMDFLNGQGFQIILAAPPAKLEVIGEKVDTILMTMREGSNSIIEEYYL